MSRENHEWEKEVIEKVKRRQLFNTIITISYVCLLPLGLIACLILNSNKIKVPTYIFIPIIALPLINLFLRTCPNCGHYFGRYEMFPNKCPKCNMKLK